MTGCRDEVKLRKIYSEFLTGTSMIDLAGKYGVTRQAISFNFHKYGLSTKVGGFKKSVANRRMTEEIERNAARDIRCMHAFGVKFSESRQVPRGIRDRYREQKRQASYRGISWEISLLEWLKIWSDSGNFGKRGKSLGYYVMARLGDLGPYKVGNVKIVTCSENIKEVRERERVSRTNI